GEQLTMVTRKALRADLGLAVPPPRVRAAERSVVEVPDGDRTLVEAADELFRHRLLAAAPGVDGLVKRSKLLHRDRVETLTRSGRPNRVRKRRQELVLPGQVLELALAVADAERDVVIGGVAERTVTEDAASKKLLLVSGQPVLLDRD